MALFFWRIYWRFGLIDAAALSTDEDVRDHLLCRN